MAKRNEAQAGTEEKKIHFLKMPCLMVSQDLHGLTTRPDGQGPAILGAYTLLLIAAAPNNGLVPWADDGIKGDTPIKQAARDNGIPMDLMDRAIKFLKNRGLVEILDDGRIYLPKAAEYTQATTNTALAARERRRRDAQDKADKEAAKKNETALATPAAQEEECEVIYLD